jgi:hypothetical protein
MVREPVVGPDARVSLAGNLSVAPRDPTSAEYNNCLEFIRLWNDFSAPAGIGSGTVAHRMIDSGPLYASLGPTFFVAAPASDVPADQPVAVEINRIRRAQALEALDHYRAAFQPEGAGDAQALRARAIQLRELFRVAWQTYSASAHGQPVNPAGFGQYLATLPAGSPLGQDVQQIKGLLSAAYLAGFTDVEYTKIVHAVLTPIAPQALSVPDFFQALTGKALRPGAAATAVTLRLGDSPSQRTP